MLKWWIILVHHLISVFTLCVFLNCRLTTFDPDIANVWTLWKNMEDERIKPTPQTYGFIARLILASFNHMELVPERWKQSISNQTESLTLEVAKMAIKEGLCVLMMLVLFWLWNSAWFSLCFPRDRLEVKHRRMPTTADDFLYKLMRKSNYYLNWEFLSKLVEFTLKGKHSYCVRFLGAH